ncbi:MAG: tRNA pseudouridine(55) synthase TruB [Chitinophagales bacterium]|nr:tRNA pseudouridine(55) synthase TruB [Chitinophagales bacterium]
MFTPEQIKEGTFLLFDKPKFWTSHDVVAKVRKELISYCGEKKLKVGHAGTLDPLASGLLILATGAFTKRIDEIQQAPKEYTGIIYLGATTPSYDRETEIDNRYSLEEVTHEKIYAAAKNFIGETDQTPPIHSAIKQEGKPVYLQARKGKDVFLQARKITITNFEIPHIDLPLVSFRVNCSKGTYIRSLAYDLGKKLNCGGHLYELTRTKIGTYDVKDSFDLQVFLTTIKNSIST